jgi:hypothetical protein
MSEPLRDMRFPNESGEYRDARDELLIAERELRRHTERVAAQRRALPLGGDVRQDYVFDEITDGTRTRVTLSDLFGRHDTYAEEELTRCSHRGHRPLRSRSVADERNLNGAQGLIFILSTKIINMTDYQCDEHDSAIVWT